jgi:hypothetical protein
VSYPPVPASFAGMPTPSALFAPSPVYLTGEEAIRLTSIGNASGVTLTLAGRVLRPDNTRAPFVVQHTPNSNRTAATTTIALPEGWLLGLEVRVTGGTPASNAVWALIELVSGGGASLVALQALASDFVSLNAPLMWPSGLNVDPLDGAGCLRSITGATPGAGAEVSETVPTAARWELLALRLRLVTDANVANRTTQLTLDDGANLYFHSTPNNTAAASATHLIAWGAGMMTPFNAQVAVQLAALPTGNRLGPGHRIRTVTGNIQVGDQYSLLQYLVREWFDV